MVKFMQVIDRANPVGGIQAYAVKTRNKNNPLKLGTKPPKLLNLKDNVLERTQTKPSERTDAGTSG